jgi:mono/diheme cytochrome c family protein
LNFTPKFHILLSLEVNSTVYNTNTNSHFFYTTREINMKKLVPVLTIVLAALSSTAMADEQIEIGKKIYERAFGRGCGTCHDIASNPQLTALIKAGQLDRARFETVLKEGKGGMPKAIEEIMKNKAVEKAGYGEDQAVDALYKYLETK